MIPFITKQLKTAAQMYEIINHIPQHDPLFIQYCVQKFLPQLITMKFHIKPDSVHDHDN